MQIETAPVKTFAIPGKWCLHSYYTLCPVAPDGTSRLLAAAADLETGTGEVVIFSPNGTVLERFGSNPLNPGFYHTSFWQTWSRDARFVYYQSGTLREPKIVRRELETGQELVLDGDMEGAPPDGEPLLSGLMGMLYAAGYGSGVYHPKLSPAVFGQRDTHGLFEYAFAPNTRQLKRSVAQILAAHPCREMLEQTDAEIASRLGEGEGLTLMAYCVRWNPKGDRLLFYFGNHCVSKSRGEPRVACIMTADRSLNDIHLAVDLSGQPGVHWAWHPDGEHLIGYGPDPENPGKMCLAQVRYDGSDYRRISKNSTGGHPSISPVDHNLLVTDEYRSPGRVLFIDLRTDTVLKAPTFPHVCDNAPGGRNPYRVDLHPVFSADGKKVFINTMPDTLSQIVEIDVEEVLRS